MSFFQSSLNRKILLLVLLLTGFGLVQVYSSSYVFSDRYYGDGLFFFKKQFLFALVGWGLLFAAADLPWKWTRLFGTGLWVLSVLLLITTLIPGMGVEVGGAKRWMDLPLGMRFQPSELFKITGPFVFIHLISLKQENVFKHPLLFWVAPLFAFGLPLMVLFLQPDFGSIVLFFFLAFGVVFVLGLKWKYIFSALMVTGLSMYLMVAWEPYRMARVRAMWDPWSDPLHTGFQVIQSMVTFHSGGFWGTGLGQGQGKLFFLPEAHTDFTFAVLGEETGFLGCLTLLTLYSSLIWYGMKVSLRTEDRMQRLLAFGLTLVFASSVITHVGVNLGAFPPKGLTLPFISYGGSALVCHLLLFGWLLNIEKRNHFIY